MRGRTPGFEKRVKNRKPGGWNVLHKTKIMKLINQLFILALYLNVLSINVLAAETFQDKLRCGKLGPRMIVLPAGRLLGRDGHPFTSSITGESLAIKHMAVSETEITNNQITCFRNDGDGKKPSDWIRRNYPAVDLTWHEAGSYARWMSTQTKRKYRLPTQAEWEYLARATTLTSYPWGDIADHDHANYGADECCRPAKSGRDQFEREAPAAQFPPNGFGLYDMNGNVWEWTSDGPSKEERYMCGGSWGGTPAMIKSSNCGTADLGYSSEHIGLRLVVDID